MGLQSASPQECIVSVAQLGECSLKAPAVVITELFVLCEVAQSLEPFQVARVPMKPRKRIVQAKSMAAYTFPGSNPAIGGMSESSRERQCLPRFGANDLQWCDSELGMATEPQKSNASVLAFRIVIQ